MTHSVMSNFNQNPSAKIRQAILSAQIMVLTDSLLTTIFAPMTFAIDLYEILIKQLMHTALVRHKIRHEILIIIK